MYYNKIDPKIKQLLNDVDMDYPQAYDKLIESIRAQQFKLEPMDLPIEYYTKNQNISNEVDK